MGLYFYQSRWYGSYITQFTQPDSIIPDPYNPLDRNRYSYARYNPIKYTDPIGHTVACDKDDWACQTHWDYPITLPNNDKYTFDTGLSEDQVETLNNVEEMLLPVFVEPVDWMQTYDACSQGDCSPLMLLGLLPLIPSSIGNKVDDIVGLLPVPKLQKHYIFPQQFRKQFEKVGIEIDKHTVELSEGLHLKGLHGKGGFVGPGDKVIPTEKWNVLWSDFFKNNPNPSAKEIYQFAGQLMDDFGLSGLPIVPYK